MVTPREQRAIAVFGAFCLFLSTIEYLLPRPLPFIRLGIANLPLLLALRLSLPAFALLAAVKVCAQALLTGALFSYVFLFSVAGTAASAAVMFGAARLCFPRFIGYPGLSILGALCSTAAQLLPARFLLLGEGALILAPPLLALATVTGLLLGLFCEQFARKSSWYAAWLQSKDIPEHPSALPELPPRAERGGGRWKNRLMLALCAAGSILLLALPSPKARLALFAVFWLAAAFRGRAGKPAGTALMFLSVVLCNLLVPYGRVLLTLGPLRITENALLAGVSRAATAAGLLMLSRIALPETPRLPGRFGALVSDALRILDALTQTKRSVPLSQGIRALDELLNRAAKW